MRENSFDYGTFVGTFGTDRVLLRCGAIFFYKTGKKRMTRL